MTAIIDTFGRLLRWSDKMRRRFEGALRHSRIFGMVELSCVRATLSVPVQKSSGIPQQCNNWTAATTASGTQLCVSEHPSRVLDAQINELTITVSEIYFRNGNKKRRCPRHPRDRR